MMGLWWVRAWLVSVVICLSGQGIAEGYRLGAGDQLSLMHSGAEDAIRLSVDADGQIRLAPLGGVRIAGLTLDAAEVEVARQMETRGFFVNPVVSLSVLEYAPVVVGGDVLNPGRFAYVPGMTVASALALSGGGQASGLTRTEMARARAEAQAGLRTANLDIALATARLARFRAALAGGALDLDAELRRQIPSAAQAGLSGILQTEADVLDTDRAKAAQLLDFWDTEISTIEAQRENFDARIAVQQEIVDSTLVNLEASQELSDRGLQTAAKLATAEQRAADARARVLELEAAKMAAARAVSLAKRERVVFLSGQARDALIGAQEMKKDLETAQYRYARFVEQLAVLDGGQAAVLADPEALGLRFSLQSVRADRPDSTAITRDTVILPGETLIVEVTAAVDDLDG